MKVTVGFAGYNGRRYSRPWIGAIVSWPVGGRAEMRWGAYVGNDSGGVCEIEAPAGAVVRWGQRDNRGGNTTAAYGVVQADGAVVECDAVQARAAWDAAHQPAAQSVASVESVLQAILIAHAAGAGISIEGCAALADDARACLARMGGGAS